MRYLPGGTIVELLYQERLIAQLHELVEIILGCHSRVSALLDACGVELSPEIINRYKAIDGITEDGDHVATKIRDAVLNPMWPLLKS